MILINMNVLGKKVKILKSILEGRVGATGTVVGVSKVPGEEDLYIVIFDELKIIREDIDLHRSIKIKRIGQYREKEFRMLLMTCDKCKETSDNPYAFDRFSYINESKDLKFAHLCKACQEALKNIIQETLSNFLKEGLGEGKIHDWKKAESPIVCIS